MNLALMQNKMLLKKLTTYELARIVGVNPNTIWRILNGKQETSAKVAVRIAKALDTTVEELFSEQITQ